MRLLIVGAGAVGSLLAAEAALGGADVSIVRRSADTRGASRSTEELVVVRPDGTRVSASVAVVNRPGALATDEPDLIVLSVRQYDLAAALESIAGLGEAVVVTTQNGVGAEDLAHRTRPNGRLLAASVTAAVTREPDGVLRWLRSGGIGLAPVSGDVGRVGRGLGQRLMTAGLRSRWLEDAAAMKWSKLLANLVGNATSAVLDLDPVAIYSHPRLFGIERDQLRETLAVMGGLGLRPTDLPGARVRLLALAVGLPPVVGRRALRAVVGGARGGKDPSLRVAVRAGGRTEVAWMNGAVARAAAELGLAAPVNARLADLVDEVAADAARRAFFAGRPDRLLEALGRT